MSKHGFALLIGVVMIVGGLVLFLVFRGIETPVIGLRQAGLVIAVLGAIDVAATWWSKRSSRG